MCVCVCVWWPERPVCRPGCAAGPPLCWEASGGEIPRCALAADSLPLPPRVVSRPSPSRWRARPPPPPPPVLWHWCHVAAPPPPAPSVPLSVRPPASFRSPSAAPRGRALVCLASPGLPRPRSVACFAAAACPPTSSRAGRGGSTGGPPPSPPASAPAAPPAPMRSPERGSGPPVCLPRAGRRVLAARHPPPLWGGRTDGRLRARRPPPRGVAWSPWVPGPAPGAAGAGGLATGGWGAEEGGGALPRPSPRSCTRWRPACCVPRGLEGLRARSGILAAGVGPVGRVGAPS